MIFQKIQNKYNLFKCLWKLLLCLQNHFIYFNFLERDPAQNLHHPLIFCKFNESFSLKTLLWIQSFVGIRTINYNIFDSANFAQIMWKFPLYNQSPSTNDVAFFSINPHFKSFYMIPPQYIIIKKPKIKCKSGFFFISWSRSEDFKIKN